MLQFLSSKYIFFHLRENQVLVINKLGLTSNILEYVIVLNVLSRILQVFEKLNDQRFSKGHQRH